jgi:polar amino acid transport system substrate-binding protein
MLRHLWFILCLLLLPISCRADLKSPSPLIVGMELSYPPFEMMSPRGTPTGVSVDIAHALGEYIDCDIKIDNIPFIGLIPSLKTDKIDLIISSMTITEERQASIDFSEPYLTTGLCLLVSKKSDLKSIDQANQKGRVIAVKSGTSGEIYASKNLKQAKVIVLDKEAACVLEVVQGKVDAFIYDQFSVFTHWQRNLKTTYALLAPFQKEHWGIGVNKGNEELLGKVNAFIDAYRQMGGFEMLGNKYLPVQKEKFKELGIPFVF